MTGAHQATPSSFHSPNLTVGGLGLMSTNDISHGAGTSRDAAGPYAANGDTSVPETQPGPDPSHGTKSDAGVTNPHADQRGQRADRQNGDGPEAEGPTKEDGRNGENAQEDGENVQGGEHRHMSDLKERVTDQKAKIKDKTKPSGGFDSTPLPNAPPGFTVKFTIHKASNLPFADIHNASADPYLEATLTADVPKRHKEDPVMTRRTRTVRRTTDPEWEEEWVVANIPSSGFKFKCRLYDEDYPDHDDRLGNVTYVATHVSESWEGLRHKTFDVKKRMGSKRAYFLKAASTAVSKDASLTPRLELSIEVLGRSEPPGAQMYTLGPTAWVKHFSPMIGRLTGIKVNRDADHKEGNSGQGDEKGTKKYDFQANEIQLQGPVPPKMYHRYVEFRPFVGRMFTSHGLRGRILNKALRKQHRRIYNFDSSTEHGTFEPCSKEAAIQFLKLVHFDEGGRTFTYVLTLDGILRFTETGKEFGIDLLSKHTMHSDVATYIACSGEFFIRRLKKPTGEGDPEPDQPTHPKEPIKGGPPYDSPPQNPSYYQLIIDNDSGTYRPDKSILSYLKSFLEHNFPGLGIVAMHWEEDELQEMKKNQRQVKKKEGKTVNMVLNRSPSASSFSSDDESRLEDLGVDDDDESRRKTKKERAWDMLEDPNRIKELRGSLPYGQKKGDSSVPPSATA